MGVRAIFQLETPWSEDEVFDLGYEQGADVMLFAHLNHPTQRLVRYDHDNWTLGDAAYLATIAAPSLTSAVGNAVNTGTGYVATLYTYVITAIDDATGQESLPTVETVSSPATDLTLKGNSVSVTWTPVDGAERYNIYRKGGGAFGFIGTTDQYDFTDDNIAPDFSQSYPRHQDPFAGDLNKPAVVTFWQQRAFYGRTYSKPNAIFASQSANLFNMNISRPLQASDAVTFAVSGKRVNAVLHLVPLKNLIVFTTDTAFSIGKDFEPTNIEINPESYRASGRVRPVVIDDIAMFSAAKGNAIRTFGFQFEADGYRGNDLTVFAPHFFRDVNVVEMTWAEFPTSTVSVVCSDGDSRLLTWQQEQQVWGWSKMHTEGVLESCWTVNEGGEDVDYYIVRRGERRFMEYSASIRWTDVADCVYLDSARRFDGDPATTFSGLDHLVGVVETITVLADGAVYSDVELSPTGTFTLPHPVSKGVAGIPFEAWARTLPASSGTGESAKGQPVGLGDTQVLVFKTRGIEVGLGKDLPPGQFEPTNSDDEIDGIIDEVKMRELEELGEPTALHTGNLEVHMGTGDWRTASVVVRQRHPLPMTVLGITPDYVWGE